ncbi:MAG: formate dehydrogenase accessory sulfurtransferase FdhD [Candidatus Lernaella stagnicola]|nr:formate dehydrogenase accessory sulfurtransferase FdhD [Candidatus Lernaella stagnicola]
MSDSTVTRQVLICRQGLVQTAAGHVVRETPLTVRLGDRELVTLLTDGTHPDELAVGFLFNEGLLDEASQIRSVRVDEKRGEALIDAVVDEKLIDSVYGKRLVTSGCGKGRIFYHVLDAVKAGRVRVIGDLVLPLTFIYEIGASLAGTSDTYKRTRGVHGAALLDNEGVVCFREDIGRHNALDKLAGWSLRGPGIGRGMALYTTGRVTSEVMLKAGRMRLPIILSRSMPTDMALQLAEQIGVTVVGGLRAGSCTIFTRPERIANAIPEPEGLP